MSILDSIRGGISNLLGGNKTPTPAPSQQYQLVLPETPEQTINPPSFIQPVAPSPTPLPVVSGGSFQTPTGSGTISNIQPNVPTMTVNQPTVQQYPQQPAPAPPSENLPPSYSQLQKQLAAASAAGYGKEYGLAPTPTPTSFTQSGRGTVSGMQPQVPIPKVLSEKTKIEEYQKFKENLPKDILYFTPLGVPIAAGETIANTPSHIEFTYDSKGNVIGYKEQPNSIEYAKSLATAGGIVVGAAALESAGIQAKLSKQIAAEEAAKLQATQPITFKTLGTVEKMTITEDLLKAHPELNQPSMKTFIDVGEATQGESKRFITKITNQINDQSQSYFISFDKIQNGKLVNPVLTKSFPESEKIFTSNVFVPERQNAIEKLLFSNDKFNLKGTYATGSQVDMLQKEADDYILNVMKKRSATIQIGGEGFGKFTPEQIAGIPETAIASKKVFPNKLIKSVSDRLEIMKPFKEEYPFNVQRGVSIEAGKIEATPLIEFENVPKEFSKGYRQLPEPPEIKITRQTETKTYAEIIKKELDKYARPEYVGGGEVGIPEPSLYEPTNIFSKAYSVPEEAYGFPSKIPSGQELKLKDVFNVPSGTFGGVFKTETPTANVLENLPKLKYKPETKIDVTSDVFQIPKINVDTRVDVITGIDTGQGTGQKTDQSTDQIIKQINDISQGSGQGQPQPYPEEPIFDIPTIPPIPYNMAGGFENLGKRTRTRPKKHKGKYTASLGEAIFGTPKKISEKDFEKMSHELDITEFTGLESRPVFEVEPDKIIRQLNKAVKKKKKR